MLTFLEKELSRNYSCCDCGYGINTIMEFIVVDFIAIPTNINSSPYKEGFTLRIGRVRCPSCQVKVHGSNIF